MPDRDARHRGGAVAARAGAQAVLGVVPLDEERQRHADVLGDRARDQAHPPGVVVDVGAPVQPAGLPQRALGEVVVRLGAGGVAPEEGVPVDDLAHRRQLRPRLQRQHLPADQHRLAGVAGERDGPQHRIGLQQDVVVHVEDLLALGGERLVHDAGVAAGAAEVGLVDDAQLVAQHRRRLLEARAVAHLLGALVGQDHGDHGVEDERVLADRGEGGDAVGGPVERGHADGDGRAAPPGLVGVPAALDEREVAARRW